jgi:hypothetical protein
VPLSGSPPTRGRPRLGCGASAHLEAGGCPIPGSSRWVLTSSTRGIASACPYLACPLTDNAQGSHRRGLGTAWAAPDAFSKSVAGVRSSEPREQECSAGLEESFVAYAPCRDAQRPGTGHTFQWHAERCSPPVKPQYQPPSISIRTITRHVGVKTDWHGASSRCVYTMRAGVANWRLVHATWKYTSL